MLWNLETNKKTETVFLVFATEIGFFKYYKY